MGQLFKLLFLATALSLCACSSDDKDLEDIENMGGSSTYYVVNEFSNQGYQGVEGVDGTIYDVIAQEYDINGELVDQKKIEDLKYGGGKSKKLKAHKSSKKVQVSFILVSKDDDSVLPYFKNYRLYAPLTSLKKNQNIKIELTDYTWLDTHPTTKSSTKHNINNLIN